ncbi:hypothetical protein BDN70DRAFT_897925 [Pholiota conissans]|uniref:Uncharacterized protein n=1 Tax=Pholiota conissans TaxID=109636 RepID=A0A9P5YWB1_9AGAR|nr:hypothetical protein BDN70DRAFT_897925 [Pholiota conissans]
MARMERTVTRKKGIREANARVEHNGTAWAGVRYNPRSFIFGVESRKMVIRIPRKDGPAQALEAYVDGRIHVFRLVSPFDADIRIRSIHLRGCERLEVTRALVQIMGLLLLEIRLSTIILPVVGWGYSDPQHGSSWLSARLWDPIPRKWRNERDVLLVEVIPLLE